MSGSREELAAEIGEAIEAAIGHDYLDDLTAYGVTLMVLEYLDEGTIKARLLGSNYLAPSAPQG